MSTFIKNKALREPTKDEMILVKNYFYNDNLNGCKRFGFDCDELKLMEWAHNITEESYIFCVDTDKGALLVYINLNDDVDKGFHKIVEHFLIHNGVLTVVTNYDII